MATPAQAPQGGLRHRWTIADRLRVSRQHTGLDRESFADQVGISRNTVGRYEKGSVKPNRIYVNAWAAFTGFDPDWLWSGDDHDDPTDGPDVAPGSDSSGVAGPVTLGQLRHHPRQRAA